MPVFATLGGLLSAAVTILAVILYFYMGIKVGQMRGRHDIKAPAISGHPEFERAFRVQQNTLEALPIFFALLWLATIYFHALAWLPALIGLAWVIGRALYMRGYMDAPEKRELGFGIAAACQILLLLLAIYGLVATWMAVNAA
ncbi:MAG: MAPEG family protein [Alphaproteobacteria bacterium]|nr:MAPEG family protein [Alphaproteobacteria bacterium]